ncbi:hypothetical protein NBRC10512_002947 [Rhodotorula toruloides]|uniref:RHTO0S20e00562g1_1 n=2 Tax=Rhodotorula toruloides TaxID=5286 RepID=A0A061BNU2_RHOTO|nr:uncharacterized protein RHTO_04269 [Rhodotorula toruloides NP11]EMS19495.1 hypothetical protein RHTO_04269 [Rhodotorula toruloides NP11]KAJ8291595.1 hypothetical protein OF846_005256 [Rhodotorula toruloides]CDR48749.1 RHTO0S20e00562g1_1 [Rhodotorula toruloides]
MAITPPGPSTRPTLSPSPPPQTASTPPRSSTAHTPLQTAPPPHRHLDGRVQRVLAGLVEFGVVVGEIVDEASADSRYSPRIGSDSVGVADGADGSVQGQGRAFEPVRGVEEVGTSDESPRPMAAERRPRARERRRMEKRQWQLPHADGYPNCNYVDNSIFTCYPESNTTLVQSDYSLVIWNAMQPSFINRQYVDVYLYNADTQDIATSWKNESNAQGMIGIVPSDPWWPGPQSAQSWFGSNAQNRTTPYFFVVVPAGQQLTGGEVHGATFRAIQTAAPSSLSSSLAALTASSVSSASSASVASASSSLSALSALSASSASALASRNGSSTGSSSPSGTSRSGSLQNESSSGPAIPRYAIALIVILGFLALVGGAIALYLLGRARRRRREREAALAAGAAGAGAGASRSGDFMSEDDFTHGSQDPILGAGGARGSASSGRPRASSSVAGAGAGTAGGSAAGAAAAPLMSERDESMLSHSDAARMAEAFRAALRRPDFPAPGPGVEGAAAAGVAAAGPGAGPSPTGAAGGDDSNGSGEGNGVGRGLLEDELRGEGKSMRQVEGRGKGWGAGTGGGAGPSAGGAAA